MIVLVGCTEPKPDSGTGEVATGAFDPIAVEPTFSTEQVEDAVEAGMSEAFLLPIDVYVWSDGLLRGSLGDAEGCPAIEESVDQPGAWTSFWNGSCTGSEYAVGGDWQYTVARSTTGGIVQIQAVELHSVWGETIPGGLAIRAGGAIILNWRADATSAELDMSFGGDYLEEGRTDPLGTTLGGSLLVNGVYDSGVGFTGTMDGPFNAPEAAIAFEDLAFTAGCAAPSGGMRVRDPSSAWWEIVLPDDCSGCGPASFDGAELGDVCVGELITSTVEGRLEPYLAGVP